MTRRSHTHGCPGYELNGQHVACPHDEITVHACYGRDAGAPDCPSVCEYDLDDETGNWKRCDDCFEAQERENDRIEIEAYKRRMAVVRAVKAAMAS